MCGIYARFTRKALHGQELEAEVSAAMRAAQTLLPRGPDDSAVWHGRHVILAHTRLAVLDPSSRAAQPMLSPDGRLCLVFNGEIYNHRELRESLESHWTFRSTGDTEVLLAAYHRWGPDCVSRLQGMFAFALWDEFRGHLLLARDRLGKKPLFWMPLPHGLAAASEIKALRPWIRGLNQRGLASLLAYGFVPTPHTLYRGVFELPPAHVLLVTLDGRETTRRYWRVQFGTGGVLPRTQEIREVFLKAVEARLQSDVPVGILLSGGLDSALVAAVIRRHLGHTLPSFTAGFPEDPRFDERRAAARTARTLGLPHETVAVRPQSLPELLPALVQAHDGPFADSSALAFHAVCRLARTQVTVALTGDGGDELFSGYHRLLAAAVTERLPRAAWSRTLPILRALEGLPAHERTFFARLARLLRHAHLPLEERLVRWQHPGSLPPDRFLDDPAEPYPLPPTSGPTALDRAAQFNLDFYLPQDLLVKADRASMAVGLEVRSPFLDERLLEAIAGLPALVRTTPGYPKLLLRLLFADLLPPHLWPPRKQGFGLPLEAWFRGALRSYVTGRLSHRTHPTYRVLRYEPVARLLAAFFAGRPNLAHKVWLLLTLAIWTEDPETPLE